MQPRGRGGLWTRLPGGYGLWGTHPAVFGLFRAAKLLLAGAKVAASISLAISPLAAIRPKKTGLHRAALIPPKSPHSPLPLVQTLA